MVKYYASFFIVLLCITSAGQERRLVWSDLFNGPAIDTSIWGFERGPSNDNVQYYTSRVQNAEIVDGNLQLIALKESYSGYDYTSALIQTKKSLNWRYGRIEARIKLPASNGFVPAFWILPAGDQYGWWPNSGEIDIMEHPTNLIDQIYGTVHTGVYNSFTGQGSKGNVIQIPGAETEFHLYAIEWTGEKVEFYVDDSKYFTFSNEHAGPGTWPFDQPFYIILNLAVGGGWVGTPDNTSVFPAKMEIDFVKVYQYLNEMSINGNDFVLYNARNISYTVPEITGSDYAWNLPSHVKHVSGENTRRINVDYGILGGEISAIMTTSSGSAEMRQPVHVSSNLIKNPGFEYGAKYWNKATAYPGKCTFEITPAEPHSGKYSAAATVESPGNNAWDISLSSKDLLVEEGDKYHVSFWARSETNASSTRASVINSSDFTVYGQKDLSLSESWSMFEFDFIAPVTDTVSLNLDLGIQTGKYFFDDFVMTTPGLSDMNLVKNADFSDGTEPWIFKTYWPAVAFDSILNGECRISIDNEGANPWDINLGQAGFRLQQGTEYELIFDAHADTPGQLSAFAGKNSDPWTVYSGNHTFSPAQEVQTFSFSFTMQEPTDDQARIGFDVGTYLADVSIDNVILREKSLVSDLKDPMVTNGNACKLYQNYPNPLNGSTTIDYELDRPSQVELKIFDDLGLEVITLAKGLQGAGIHHVMWIPVGLPDGTYYCRLRAGDHSVTKKIIVLSEH